MASFSPYNPHNTHLDMVETALPPPPPYSGPTRNASIEGGRSSWEAASCSMARRDSLPAYRSRDNSIGSICTRSIAYGAGVTFEWPAGYEANDGDIIVVAVRISQRRQQEATTGYELPERPPARSFLRRMSTRLGSIGGGMDDAEYKAIRMPRRDYKRYFLRDGEGNYAGTEPQREWGEADLEREFGMYQSMRLSPLVGL